MMLKSRLACALLAAGLLCGHVQAIAGIGKKSTNVGPAISSEKYPDASATETLRLAHALMRVGYAHNDPLALITAARLKQAAGSAEANFKRVQGKAGETKSGAEKLTVAAALDRARELAGGRTDLVALIDDTAKTGSRGAVGGPRSASSVVSRDDVDVYMVTFRGGEPARVLVSGDGDSDLDLYVYDENGNQVCKDDDSSDDMICSWSPRWTGDFKIRIRNRGMANRYVMVTN